jgi:DHA1 family tetracycline resistance protein-like MFS transporter
MERQMSEATPPAPAEGLSFNRVAPIFALTLVDVLGLTVILPLLHLYAIQFGASPLQIGLVAATFPLCQLVGVPVMGALSDRYGRKPLLLISQITTCISFIMLAFAGSLEMVILSRVVDGLFGANLSTAQAAITDVTDESTRARGLGLTGAAFGIGFILGPIISLVALEIGDSLALPALTAAIYSFISILLTAFVFKETLPPEKRGITSRTKGIRDLLPLLRLPNVKVLLVLLFAEQFIFFGFEAFMGTFTLSKLGLLGQGNAVLFLIIGIILVAVQARYIGKWVKRYGVRNLLITALVLLSIGLFVVATTPNQPHPFYVQANAAYDLRQQTIGSTQAIFGGLGITLPPNGQNGIVGVLWFIVALVPLSIGASLVRPTANSLLTKQVTSTQFGSILGLSASVISLANALSPMVCGLLFQQFGATTPFWLGAICMALLALTSLRLVKR